MKKIKEWQIYNGRSAQEKLEADWFNECKRTYDTYFIEPHNIHRIKELTDLCASLSNDSNNYPIKTIKVKGIANSCEDVFKNAKETRKYLSNEKKSIESIFLKSIFNHFAFNSSIKDYLRYCREFFCKVDMYLNMCIAGQIERFTNFMEYNIKDIAKWDNEIADLLFPGVMQFLQCEWIKTYTLHNFLGKGQKDQGSLNGPDFLFRDKYDKKIGIEIVKCGIDYIDISGKKIRNVDNYMNGVSKNLSGDQLLFSRSLPEYIKQIKKIIELKLNKPYQKCDRMYLLILIQSIFSPTPFNFLARIIVNNNASYSKKFNKIIIT